MKPVLSVFFAAVLLSVGALPAPAQDEAPRKSLLRQFGTLLDTLSGAGLNRQYVDLPAEPWQAGLTAGCDATYLRLKSTFALDPALGDRLILEPHVGSGMRTGVGFYFGYRLLAGGYQVLVGPKHGSAFNLAFGENAFRVGVSYRRYTSGHVTMEENGTLPSLGITNLHTTNHYNLSSDMRIKTLLVDAYYVFNSKKFSNGAILSQSTYQLRSAGSVIAGAAFFTADVNVTGDDDNALFIATLNGVGRTKVRQLNIGAGYAYNYVPRPLNSRADIHRGLWLISAMLMPMMSTYNRLNIWTYDLGYSTDPTHPTLVSESKFSAHSRVTFSVNARLGAAFSKGRFYATAYVQMHRFGFRRTDNSGRILDWQAKLSTGYRF